MTHYWNLNIANMDPLNGIFINDDRWSPRIDLQLNSSRFLTQCRRNNYAPSSANCLAQIYNQQFNYLQDPLCRFQSSFYRQSLLTLGDWRLQDRDRFQYIDNRQNRSYMSHLDEYQNRMWLKNYGLSRNCVPSRQRSRIQRFWGRDGHAADKTTQAPRVASEISLPQNIERIDRRNEDFRGRKFRPEVWTPSLSAPALEIRGNGIGIKQFSRSGSIINLVEQDYSKREAVSWMQSKAMNVVAPMKEFHPAIDEDAVKKNSEVAECAANSPSTEDKDTPESEKWNWFSTEEQELIVKMLKEVDMRHEKQMEKDKLLDLSKASPKLMSVSPATGNGNKIYCPGNFTNGITSHSPDCHGDDISNEHVCHDDSSSSDDGIVIILPTFNPDQISEIATVVEPSGSSELLSGKMLNDDVSIKENVDNNWGKFCRGWGHKAESNSNNSNSVVQSDSSSQTLTSDTFSIHEDNGNVNEVLTSELKMLLGISNNETHSSLKRDSCNDHINIDDELYVEKKSSFQEIDDDRRRELTVSDTMSPGIDEMWHLIRMNDDFVQNVEEGDCVVNSHDILATRNNYQPKSKSEAVNSVCVPSEISNSPLMFFGIDNNEYINRHHQNIFFEPRGRHSPAFSSTSSRDTWHHDSRSSPYLFRSEDSGSSTEVQYMPGEHIDECCFGSCHSIEIDDTTSKCLDSEQATADLKRLLGVSQASKESSKCNTDFSTPKHFRNGKKDFSETQCVVGNGNSKIPSDSEVLRDMLGITGNNGSERKDVLNININTSRDVESNRKEEKTRSKNKNDLTSKDTKSQTKTMSRPVNSKENIRNHRLKTEKQPISNLSKVPHKTRGKCLQSGDDSNTSQASKVVSSKESERFEVQESKVKPAKKKKNRKYGKQKNEAVHCTPVILNSADNGDSSRIKIKENVKINKEFSSEYKNNKQSGSNLKSNRAKSFQKSKHDQDTKNGKPIGHRSDKLKSTTLVENTSTNRESNNYFTDNTIPTKQSYSPKKLMTKNIGRSVRSYEETHIKSATPRELRPRAETAGRTVKKKAPGLSITEDEIDADTCECFPGRKKDQAKKHTAVKSESSEEKKTYHHVIMEMSLDDASSIRDGYKRPRNEAVERRNNIPLSYHQESTRSSGCIRKNTQRAKLWRMRMKCPSKRTAHQTMVKRGATRENYIPIFDKRELTKPVVRDMKQPYAFSESLFLEEHEFTTAVAPRENYLDLSPNRQEYQKQFWAVEGHFGIRTTRRDPKISSNLSQTSLQENVNECIKIRSVLKENVMICQTSPPLNTYGYLSY